MSFIEELTAMISAEEKRLGVGSEEFMRKHNEIMEDADRMLQQNKAKGEAHAGTKRYNDAKAM